MTLTAPELHALYSPLWDRAPETKPGGLWLEWFDDSRHRVFNDGKEVPTKFFAALCQSLALGFVLSRLRGDDLRISTSDYGVLLTFDSLPHAAGYRQAEGPTIHHALVAAAMAVAAKSVGLGVAP